METLNTETRAARDQIMQPHYQGATGILHLGGHLGQEAGKYAKYTKPVIWVEAIPDIFKRLQENLKQYPGQRALCALLGDVDGRQVEFHISNNVEGVSSSIFEFGEYGSGEKSLWPSYQLAMVGNLTLSTTRLDSLLAVNMVNAADYDFWVVDLQGAELIALKGGVGSLEHCRALYIEVSTVSVYDGGVLWDELSNWLAGFGFKAMWKPEIEHDDVLFIRDR